ncbi:hypothetical protein FHS16_001614 [Paenibacillus endophyticus]|uniref:HEAT repeat domain-containing protein n=2 Tax=Paenibacillus endophyticus TaxID=1294268 RepID=A0A7W5G9R4_9BACL|nr:hypothetical protein [Paenibacillus endophyticus]MBB3151568.1 hypothetical protein [Paenibacillus endophyticus]
MSILLLRELHEDVRRLMVAGASMAMDDTRLKRALPQLQLLGEKAPIFKRVAEEVSSTTESRPEHAAGKLLDLAVLLQAVLHTQSSTDTPGEVVPVGTTQSRQAGTTITYRKLKPLLDALTLRGSGRLEIIRQGKEEGSFADLRTYFPAVLALRDSYAEIADYVAVHVIPALGKAVIPVLQHAFNRDGNSGDARILIARYKLSDNPEELWPLLSSVAKEAALPVRLSAISLMSDSPHFQKELLELSYSRKKEIREAALNTLSSWTSPEIDDRFMEALMGKDAEFALWPIQVSDSVPLTEKLLDYGRSLIEKSVHDSHVIGVRENLARVLHGLKPRADQPSVIAFLLKAMDNNELEFKGTESLSGEAANLLLHSNDKNALLYLHELRENKAYFIGYSLKAALHIYDSVQVYNMYEGYFTTKKSKYVSDLLQAVYQYAENPLISISFDNQITKSFSWDERWVDRFIDLNEEELVCRIVKTPSEKVIAYLLEKAKVSPQLLKPRTLHIFYALFRLGHRDTPELVLSALELATKKSYYYLDRDSQFIVAMLPNRYAEQVSMIADKITYEYGKNQLKQLAEHIASKPAEFVQNQEGAEFLSWIKSKLS